MSRLLTVTAAVLLCCTAAACSDDTPSGPSTPTPPKFTAQLLPANEVPAITNDDRNGSGTVSITLNVTRDASQQINTANADFTVTLQGFPAGTSLTGAHIHEARPGVNGSIVVPISDITEGTVILANGSGTFTRTNVNVPVVVAQNMLNDPIGFYFNIHTTLNRTGATRGQLVKQ